MVRSDRQLDYIKRFIYYTFYMMFFTLCLWPGGVVTYMILMTENQTLILAVAVFAAMLMGTFNYLTFFWVAETLREVFWPEKASDKKDYRHKLAERLDRIEIGWLHIRPYSIGDNQRHRHYIKKLARTMKFARKHLDEPLQSEYIEAVKDVVVEHETKYTASRCIDQSKIKIVGHVRQLKGILYYKEQIDNAIEQMRLPEDLVIQEEDLMGEEDDHGVF